MRETTRKAALGLLAVAAAGGMTAGIADAAKNGNSNAAKKAAKAKAKARANARRHGRHFFGPGRAFAPPQELTGDDLAKAKAAGEAAVPCATLDHAFKTPDGGPSGDVVYAVIMQKSDGSHTLVLLDKDFNVVRTMSGPPHGGPGGPGFGPGGPPNEPELTGDDADKAKQAALGAVPGGTVMRASKEDPAENTGATYEVHVRKSDGSGVVVLLDENFAVLKTVAEDHPGGPCPPDGPHGRGEHGWGPPPGAPPAQGSDQQPGDYAPGAPPQQYT